MNKTSSRKGYYSATTLHLKRNRTQLQNKLKNSCNLALKHCNPNMDLHFNENQSCLAIWEEITNVASLIDEIDNHLDEIDSL
jgi:molybdenum cofactor biosynthesis enzyme MoaA